jgi:hypothetical protein
VCVSEKLDAFGAEENAAKSKKTKKQNIKQKTKTNNKKQKQKKLHSRQRRTRDVAALYQCGARGTRRR